MTTPATLGLALKARRKELGLTQVELAAKAGLRQHYVSQAEHGRLSLALLLKLAEALELDLALTPRS